MQEGPMERTVLAFVMDTTARRNRQTIRKCTRYMLRVGHINTPLAGNCAAPLHSLLLTNRPDLC